MHIRPFERVGPRPVPGASAGGQWWFPESGSHQGRCVVERVPPLLDGDRTVEQKGIKGHLPRVTIWPTDHKQRSDVTPPLNPPLWVVGRFRPEEIRDAGGESPYFRGSQSSV